MIVSHKDAKAIAAGRLDEIRVDGPAPEKGDVEPVIWSAEQPAECEVRVLESWPHNDGGHVVRFTLLAYDTPRFLHRQSQKGYTTEAALSLEPVEVPKGYTDQQAPLRASQQRLLNAAKRDSLSLGAQLDAYLADARESRQDIRNREAKIRREIELLAKDLADAEEAA